MDALDEIWHDNWGAFDSELGGRPWLSGEQIAALYGQTQHWIDKDGNAHELAEMSDSYLGNLRGFLERNGRGHLIAAEEYINNVIEAKWSSVVGVAQTVRTLSVQATPLYKAVARELERRRRAWTDTRTVYTPDPATAEGQAYFVKVSLSLVVLAKDSVDAYRQVRDIWELELEGTTAEEWPFEITVREEQ